MEHNAKQNGNSYLSRETLIGYIEENPDKSAKRDIAKAFGLKAQEKIKLKALLKELVDEGDVGKEKRNFYVKGGLPKVVVLDVVSRGRDGELMAVPRKWESEEDVPKIFVVQGKRNKTVGVNDRILAKIEKIKEGYKARVIKRIDKDEEGVFGVFRTLGRKNRKNILGYIEPVERKKKEIEVAENEVKAEDGDLVEAEMISGNRSNLTHKVARIDKVICNFNDQEAISTIALHQFGIPHVFPQEVVKETEEIKDNELGEREDWTHLPFVTIDPEDARDHDDAIVAEVSEKEVVISVAIADVAHYVGKESKLDKEALKRSNSVYLPDRVVPMLPERLSNDLCSLKENVNRPALAVTMRFNNNGRAIGHTFHRVLIKSHAKLSYEKAQEIIDGGIKDEFLQSILTPLKSAYDVLRIEREERAPLDLVVAERKIVIDKKNGKIERVYVPERLEAHKLVEEFMIQANVAAAKTLGKKSAGGTNDVVYRVHDSPALAKLESLRQVLKSLSISLAKGGLRSHHFNSILKKVRETQHQELVNQVVLRTQSQAMYDTKNIGHFGLNLTHYTHFTSPIRRYSDLIVHRALIDSHKWDKPTKKLEGEELDDVCEQMSQNERRAMAAERQSLDRLIAHHLADKIGSEFSARINGAANAGLFITLEETGADGFVPMNKLDDDYYIYVEEMHCVFGKHRKLGYQIGDPVNVKLLEATPVAGGLLFAMISEGKKIDYKPSRQNSGRRGLGNRGGNHRGKRKGRR